MTLIGWGMWPYYRKRCGLPMRKFVIVNILTQFVLGWTYLLVLGSVTVGGNSVVVLTDVLLNADYLSKETIATFFGGFLLGHGDHLGSFAMEFAASGIIYPIYGSSTLVGGTLMDYFIDGTKSPSRLFVSVALIAIAIYCLTRTLDSKESSSSHEITEEEEEDSVDEVFMENAYVGLPNDEDAVSENASTDTKRVALISVFFAALCSTFWSPLFALGHRDGAATKNPYVSLVTFVSGEVCAIPSVALIGTCARRRMRSDGGSSRPSLWKIFKSQTSGATNVNAHSVAWGMVCGFSVSLGYLGYLYALDTMPSTKVFPIVACNPVVSLIHDVILGEFSGSPLRRWFWLVASASLYAAAIAIISSIPE